MPFKVLKLPKEQKIKKWEVAVKFVIFLLKVGKSRHQKISTLF